MNETGIFQRANGNNEERVLTCIQLGKREYKPSQENVYCKRNKLNPKAFYHGTHVAPYETLPSTSDPTTHCFNTRGSLRMEPLLYQNEFACSPPASYLIPQAILSA